MRSTRFPAAEWITHGHEKDEMVEAASFMPLYVPCCKTIQMMCCQAGMRERVYCALCGTPYEPDYTRLLHEEKSEEE